MGGRERATHIDIRKHFAHEAVQNRHMRLHKISAEHQLADLLTKPLHRRAFEHCQYNLLGKDPPSLAELASEGGETGWISSWSHVGP